MIDSLHPFIGQINTALAGECVPDSHQLSLLDALVSAQPKGEGVLLSFDFGYPCESLFNLLNERIRVSLDKLGIQVEVEMAWHAAGSPPSNNDNGVEGVSNIIAIASGKGGVGKSTTTANLALALVAEGARVGVLDADIYGPSQAHMLGVPDQKPQILAANVMAPIDAVGGVKMVSMGNLVTDKTPMVWRGPMASGALQQLLRQTHWPHIDYLLIDMPPGTGDIQLTLSQTVPVSGSVIVTTPQDIALLDAKKGIEMFTKVNIPVLGVVENMAMHTCSQCGYQEAIFGESGGDKLSNEYDVPLLGRLPLALSIREQADSGLPSVIGEPESEYALAYQSIARRMCLHLWHQSKTRAAGPTVQFVDD